MNDGRHRSVAFLAVVVFFAARVVLLLVRDPFFDELFSVWMARQPFGQIVPLLRNDSGPPLFYFLARFDSFVALRLVSLVFATVQFALVMRRSAVAGLLLALYPPAALFAVDGRAYALCAMFVTAGVLAWHREKDNAAAVFFALAGYSHYYGVLFFPLLLLGKNRRSVILATVLFLPGFFLAFSQPSASAMAWAREVPWPVNLSFAGRYPLALFAPSPWWLVVIALALLIAKPDRFALAAFVPFLAIVALHVVGKRVYFPMRFESVIAAPMALWLANVRWRPPLLAAIGAAAIVIGIRSHLDRPMDPYREGAQTLMRNAAPDEPIVASGYLYLEASVAMRRNVLSFPAEQARHPGWRSRVPRPDPRELPQGPFLWIGERTAPELAVIRGVRKVETLFENERTVIARGSLP